MIFAWAAAIATKYLCSEDLLYATLGRNRDLKKDKSRA